MLGNFSYCNPTKLHFGPEALDALAGELAHYGKRVQLIYGGGSIKKNGIYDQVVSILKAAGKEIFEDPGVMPNPTTEKLYEGCKIARENNVDLLLAVGGGSCGSMVADALAAGCDTFVTADVKYDQYLQAKAQGLTLMDAGHFATENVVCAPLARWLSDRIPGVEAALSQRHREVYQGV